MLREFFRRIDWALFLPIVPLVAAGIMSMSTFAQQNYFAPRQIIWALVSFTAFFICANIDWRFLRRTSIVVIVYVGALLVLALLFIVGVVVHGAQSWIHLGLLSLQPADFSKLVVILILAKYFSRRHIEIAHYRHIVVSGIYALVPFLLILIQPDFGSAIIIFLIWLGMIMVSGVSKKHLLYVFLAGAGAFLLLWLFVFAPYQKARIATFINPLSDIHGSGYNAFQSTVAVGSGQLWGKGVGYGTQSRLEFLPEYETDFIFAAFSEEWGFVGVLLVFVLLGILFWRILKHTTYGASNFEILFGAGYAIFLMAHLVINIGMNIGLLPITGITMPFLSYGGSHLLVECIGLGMIAGMSHYSRGIHKEDMSKEFVGI